MPATRVPPPRRRLPGLLPAGGALLLTLAAAAPGLAEQEPAAAGPPWAEVRAVLEASCLRCHGGEEVRSGLRFATAETFRAGGSRGPEFLSTHPSADRRAQELSDYITAQEKLGSRGYRTIDLPEDA